MSETRVSLITGAGRGGGVYMAKAALAAGHLGARFNQARARYVGWLFVAISGVQFLLGRPR